MSVDVTAGRPLIGIVDDDSSVRKALQRLVRSHGFSTDVYSSAEDLLQGEVAGGMACLILDVRMPGLSGLDLQIRLAAAGSRLPIIFITAQEDPQAKSQAMSAGAVGYLQKPFDDEDLLTAIHAAIDPE